MVPKSRIENLPPYKPGKQVEEVKREYNLKEVIKLASNENPFGCSIRVKETLMEAINQLEVYPDGSNGELRTSLSSFLNVSFFSSNLSGTASIMTSASETDSQLEEQERFASTPCGS